MTTDIAERIREITGEINDVFSCRMSHGYYITLLLQCNELFCEVRSELATLRSRVGEAEQKETHLRAALANSKDPCVYCQLPLAEMAKCKSGFPGCGRADDMSGCPEFGSMMIEHMLREELATLRENVRRLAETAKFLEVVAYPSSGLPDRYIVHKNEMNALRAALAPFAERKEPTDGR